MGCVNNEFNYIERSLRRQLEPADLKTNFKLSLGPISMSAIRGIVSFTDADQMAIKHLKNIRKVQVGVYELHDGNVENIKLEVPANAVSKLKKLGWEVFVRVKEKDESVVLLYKDLGRNYGSMYVLTINESEVVIVEVVGNLENIIEEALDKKSFSHKDIVS